MIPGLFERIREFWHWITANKYVRALEDEIERLRAENRALMNSILGIAGIPPVIVPPNGASASTSAHGATAAAPGSNSTDNNPAVTPLRRRSWQQINRTLEIESARKKEPAAEMQK